MSEPVFDDSVGKPGPEPVPADPRIEKSGFAPVDKSASRPEVPEPQPAPWDGRMGPPADHGQDRHEAGRPEGGQFK
jgi:hypothetical protein